MKLHLKGQISDRQQLLRQGSLPFPQHHISITAGSQLLQLSSVAQQLAKGQQQPGHQWCTNHLHNGIDGQDDLERCLTVTEVTQVTHPVTRRSAIPRSQGA